MNYCAKIVEFAQNKKKQSETLDCFFSKKVLECINIFCKSYFSHSEVVQLQRTTEESYLCSG